MGIYDSLLGNGGGADLVLGLSMLGYGAPRPGPRNFGQDALGALMQAKSYADAQEQKRIAEQERAMKQRVQEAQIGEYTAQAQQRMADAQKAQQVAERNRLFLEALQKRPQPGAAMTNGQGPTQENAAALTQMQTQPIDWEALSRQFPDKVEELKKLAEARNFGRDKVARTVKGLGPDGREYEYQVDEFGKPVGQGFAQYRAPIQIQQGDRTTLADAYSLNPVAAFKQFMSPDAQASNAVSWARLSFDKQKDAREQATPKLQYDPERGVGIDLRTGQAVPITQDGKPLGPKQKDLNDTQAKALLFGTRAQEADKIINSIVASGTTTPGLLRQAGNAVPGIAGAPVRVIGNMLQTENEQKLEQAKRDFLTALLRRESGAVISKEEFAQGDEQYFPQPFDSPAVIQQKAKNRALATQMIMREVPGTTRPATSVDDLVRKYGG